MIELHIDPSSPVDIYIQPSALPTGSLPGDLIAIRPAHIGKGKAKDRPLLYKVEEVEAASKTRRGKAQVLVSASAAAGFGWIKSRTEVTLTLVIAPPPPQLTASHVELYFSAVYLSRSDMMRLSLSLSNTSLFLNQRVTLPGSAARIRVGGIYNLDYKKVRSAWVDEDTKIIFRSESARSYVFVEVSQEMDHFEEDGSMLKEKCEVFLKEFLERIESTSHTLSIILYGRVIYEDNGQGEEERAPLRKTEDGVLYRDFFKVILDVTQSPPPSIVRTVATEINRWNEDVLLRLTPSGEQKLSGRIAYAHESPVLEAINLALNSFEEHWVDRDLQRTGLSLIVLTAGTSFYQVPKSLLRLTTERMLCHGIGLDLISLSKTPLHTVPLFSFRSCEPGLSDESSSQQKLKPSSLSTSSATSGALYPKVDSVQRASGLPDDQRDPLYYDPPHPSQITSIYYAEPMFVFCSFFGFQIDKPHRIDRFMPRARCYELFSQGIGDRIPIAIPLLPDTVEERDEEGWKYLSEKEKRIASREKYDAIAVGGNPHFQGSGDMGWMRESGTTNGTTEDESAEERRAEEDSRGRKASISKQSRGGDGGRTPVPLDRGREERSKTPMGRPAPRSSSKANSVRTISSVFSKPDTKGKGSTPALISRLTSAPMPGWLGMLRGATSSGTTAAPLLSVQKVDARANVKPDLEIEAASARSVQSRGTSPSSGSLRSFSSNTILVKPTAPISILSRPVPIPARASEQIKPLAVSNSSLKKFGGSARISGVKPLEGRFNPSKPGKRSLGLADQARRWASIFIRHSNDQRAVNWVSITRGACLPITTDYLPTTEALASDYQTNTYSVSTLSAASSFLLRSDNAQRSPALELVSELISQRLSHGFQICTPAEDYGTLDEWNKPTAKSFSDALHDVDEGEATAIYLSLANQIHRISYDRSSQSIVVKIMRRRRTWAKVDYGCSALFWTLGATAWDFTDLKFPYPDLISPVDWEHLDRLVAGLERPDLRPSLRYWRTRLILLPAESIPDREYSTDKAKAAEGKEMSHEEIQLQGFAAFMELIQNARWITPGTNKEATPTEITSLSPPEWAAKSARESSTFRQDVNALVARQSRWLRRVTPGTTRDGSGGSVERERSMSPSRQIEDQPTSPTPPVKTVVQMSYSVTLDLDAQKKSGRAERVLCHFDRSHNPLAAYHVELSWLAGSGKIIDGAIQSWGRVVNRYGLNLIEVGTRGLLEVHNPFQRAVKIGLCFAPPVREDQNLPHHFYESEILRHLNFYLDIGSDLTFSPEIDPQYSYRRSSTAYSQYIHRSGTLLVSIIGGRDGFACVPNRIFNSHSDQAVGSEMAVMDSLKRLCEDEAILRKLWDVPEEVEKSVEAAVG